MKKILFALCLLLFASCTRDVVLVLPPVSPRLVLNASVSPDTDVTASCPEAGLFWTRSRTTGLRTATYKCL